MKTTHQLNSALAGRYVVDREIGLMTRALDVGARQSSRVVVIVNWPEMLARAGRRSEQ